MYLGIACYVTKRKTARCRNGGCGRDIMKGEPAVTIVRKGSRGRSYRWFHPQCFLGWAEHLYQRRRQYYADNPPERSGRPEGSTPVADLIAECPELGRERATCLRRRARVMREMLSEEDEKRLLWLYVDIKRLDTRIKEILPLQIDSPGHRTQDDRDTLDRKLRDAGNRLSRLPREEREYLETTEDIYL